jgi:hypothetical protein
MRIEKDQLIAGIPARDLRRFMREAAGYIIRARTVTEVLGFSKRSALKFLRALQAEGLVAVTEDFWEATERGHALAMATAAVPLRRATAERLIEQVVERAQEINRNDGLAYRVHWLALFGSSLAGAERPNDVDVACALTARFDGEKQRTLEDERREARGRFANSSEWAVWPKLEILKRLKARSHRLSIQEFGSSASKRSIISSSFQTTLARLQGTLK